jgi:hypothetical protein
MLQRGLSRITNSESFDLVGNVTSIEAGAPVAGIFNNAKMKLEAAVDNSVDTTLAHWQFLGFAFNKYCKPSDTKWQNLEIVAGKITVSDTDYAAIAVDANVFDSTTTNITLYSVGANGAKTAISTAVNAITGVDAATKYFLDATNKQIVLDASLENATIVVQYTVALNSYAAELNNQFGPNIFTALESKINVITEAQVVAIDSKFVNAAGYIATGVYNKAPACYLTANATTGAFEITIGGSTGTALKNLLFLGFEGNSALFKLTPNSNLA